MSVKLYFDRVITAMTVWIINFQLPQVSDVDTKKGEHPHCHLLLQISGMMLGAGIMFLIALFEHDLKNIFWYESVDQRNK